MVFHAENLHVKIPKIRYCKLKRCGQSESMAGLLYMEAVQDKAHSPFLFLSLCVFFYVWERNRNILFWSSYHVCVFSVWYILIQTKAKRRTSASQLASKLEKNPWSFFLFLGFLHLWITLDLIYIHRHLHLRISICWLPALFFLIIAFVESLLSTSRFDRNDAWLWVLFVYVEQLCYCHNLHLLPSSVVIR